MKRVLKHLVVTLLTLETKGVLRKYRPHIVAVTGNVGKTSTKDMIYSVMSSSYFVRKSEKTLNTEIGVPLSVLGLPNAWSSVHGWTSNLWEGLLLLLFPHRYPHWLVLEVGADRPGDIAHIASYLHCDIVVLTRLPDVPVHIEYFPSPAALRAEKLSLLKSLKADGILIGNADDPYIAEVLGRERSEGRTVLSFGKSEHADVRLVDHLIRYAQVRPVGTDFIFSHGKERMEVFLAGGIGSTHGYALAGAIASGVALNIPYIKILKALAAHALPPGRMRTLEGQKGSTLIDDTYNASPTATAEALETLKHAKARRRIAVLADMLELGEHSVAAHAAIGRLVADCADFLVTIGVRARRIADDAH